MRPQVLRPGVVGVRSVTGAVGAVGRALAPSSLRAVRRSVGAGALGHDPAPPPPDGPHASGGRFRNTEPMRMLADGSSRLSLARDLATKGRTGRPAAPVPLVRPAWAGDAEARAAGCAATWLGHATVLLEVGGHWVLTDPVWSERCSPSADVGPRRNHPVPVAVADLPRLSAVLVSHDHYDHLDTATVDALVATQDAVFVVPLGVGAHLRLWGVPADRVVELDWGQTHEVTDGPGDAAGPLRLTSVEARHFSGRSTTDDLTLWSAWRLVAGERSVLFGGDSGYTPAMAAGAGGVDLAVLPVGAYDRRWPDVHMDPEEAVRTHLELGAAVLLPIHWATFDLAFHPWAEPAERVRAEAGRAGVRLAQPRPGERVDAAAAASGGALPTDPWWRRGGSPRSAG